MKTQLKLPGRYRIVRPIGKGGMGMVYVVADEQAAGRVLALKTCSLRWKGDGTLERARRLESFRREFLTLSGLRHPSLPRVRDFGLLPGGPDRSPRWFFTYDYVEGQDLLAWSAERKPDELLAAAWQLIDLLSLLHSRGILHLDIKPANVIVEQTASGARAKLIDFGTIHTGDGAPRIPLLGTLPYAAPEVLRGEPAGPAADLYSLGVTLFQCRFRILPYEGTTALELRRQHASRLPLTPAGWKFRGGGRLESLIWRLLARDTARRTPEPPVGAGGAEIDFSSRLHSQAPAGMERAITSLLAEYGRASRGSPGPALIIIEGEAGAGKTRLLRELRSRVLVQGGRFAHVELGDRRGADLQDPIAAALLSLAGDGSRPAREFGRRIGRAGSCEIPWDGKPPACEPIAGRREAVWSLLGAVAGARPLVLAVDDLHLAGGEWIAELAILARRLFDSRRSPRNGFRPQTIPVLICAARRPEAAPAAPEALEEIIAAGVARRERLRPLGGKEIRRFLEGLFGRGAVPGEVARFLEASSGGNPFVLAETVSSLIETGSILHRPGRALMVKDPPELWRVPRSVEELLDARWKRLGADEVRLAALLSAAIAPVSPAAAQALSPFPPKTTARLLGSLGARLILEPSGHGSERTFSFAHPRLREQARAALSSVDCREASSRLIRVREGEKAPAWELARLHAAAGEAEQAAARGLEALDSLQLSTDSRRVEEVAGILLPALPAADHRRREVILRLAGALSLRGDHRGAARLLEEALLREFASANALQRGRCHALLAAELLSQREYDRARAGFQKAIAFLRQCPNSWAERASAGAGLLRLEINHGNRDPARRLARDLLARLARAPRSAERDRLECAVLAGIGSLEAAAGDYRAGQRAYERGFRLLRNLPDSPGKGGLALNLANLQAAGGDHRQAARSYERARRIARALAARDLEVLAGANLALLHLLRWDLQAAEQSMAEAARVARGSSAARHQPLLDLIRAALLIRRGDTEEAFVILEAERRRARRDRDPAAECAILYQIAKGSLERGENSRAARLARAGLRLARRLGRPRLQREGRLLLGLVHLHLADAEGAIQDLQAAEEIGGDSNPAVEADLALYRGLALCRAGDRRQGKAMLRRAARIFRRLRIPLRLAESLHRLAEIESAAGRSAGAREMMDAAWSLVSGVPAADAPAQRAEILLGRAGMLLPEIESGGPLLLELFQDLTQAHDLLGRKHLRRLEWQIAFELAVALGKLGDGDGAAALQEEARRTLALIAGDSPPPLARRLLHSPAALALAGGVGSGTPAEPGGIVTGEAGGGRGESRMERLESSFAALAEENRRLRSELARLAARTPTGRLSAEGGSRHAPGPRSFFGLIGASPAMERLFELIEKAAGVDLPVVVRGESGAGKDLVMRALHLAGPRRDRPFIIESLAALPESLLESELFGHAEGAFSGAEMERPGRLAAAAGGTVCLSGVDELPLSIQAKLLTALQTRAIRPLGASEARPIDFRLVSSSRIDLRRAAAEGRLREDLLYRLLGLEILIPPLRDRIDDLPLLLNHFLEIERERSGWRPRVDPGALEALHRHDWPGNVRELENEVRRLAILAPARIRAADFLLYSRLEPVNGATAGPRIEPGESLSLEGAREALDRAYIDEALRRSGGRVAEAARRLGIHERSLYKLRRRLES